MIVKNARVTPAPSHTRQTYEQTSGQKHDPKCFKTRQTRQFWRCIFVHILALYVGGWGFKMIPQIDQSRGSFPDFWGISGFWVGLSASHCKTPLLKPSIRDSHTHLALIRRTLLGSSRTPCHQRDLLNVFIEFFRGRP